MAAGGVIVPINPLNPSEEIAREIKESGAENIIILDRLLNKVSEKPPGNLLVAEAAAYVPWHLRTLSRLRGERWSPKSSLSLERLLKEPPKYLPSFLHDHPSALNNSHPGINAVHLSSTRSPGIDSSLTPIAVCAGSSPAT